MENFKLTVTPNQAQPHTVSRNYGGAQFKHQDAYLKIAEAA